MAFLWCVVRGNVQEIFAALATQNYGRQPTVSEKYEQSKFSVPIYSSSLEKRSPQKHDKVGQKNEKGWSIAPLLEPHGSFTIPCNRKETMCDIETNCPIKGSGKVRMCDGRLVGNNCSIQIGTSHWGPNVSSTLQSQRSKVHIKSCKL